jgi:diguanylate cyclase (GGDEF)-like protein
MSYKEAVMDIALSILFLAVKDFSAHWAWGEWREDASFVTLSRGRSPVAEVLRGKTPDLLFLILDLSKPSSVDLVRQFKACWPGKGPSIVLVPERVEPRNLAAALLAGADGCVDVNAGLSDLCGFVEKAMKIKALQAELTTLRKLLGEQETRDELTGLLNAQAIRKDLKDEFKRARRYRQFLSLVLVDVDYFKDINRTYGYHAGDEVLKRLGGLIGESLRDTDLLGRHNGEDFMLVFPHTPLHGARDAGLRIARAIREMPIELGGSLLHVTVSSGISCYPGPGICSADDLLSAAEKALAAAKEMGRDAVCCWHEVRSGAPKVERKVREEIEEARKKFYRLSQKIKSTYIESTRTLVKAIEAKDRFTKEHSRKVMTFAVGLARRFGIPEEEVEVIRNAAILHDVGKIGIPEEILMKPGRLTEEEYSLMKTHPAIGADIVGQAQFLVGELPIIRHHHERFDGKGYPSGLRGEEIPLAARIVSIADAFDAMTSERVYRRKMGIDNALREIQRCAGTQFDPNLVTSFSEIAHQLCQKVPALVTPSNN